MKIAVVAANGRVGRLVVKEAVDRGNDVTAFVREDANDTVAQHVVKKDLFDLTTDDLKDFDVVIDAFGAWAPEALPLHVKSLMHLVDILKGADVRLLVVGGAGSLYVDSERKMRLVDTPDFPDEFKPLASAQVAQFDELEKNGDEVEWTYISPAADFQADGERTGECILAGDELTTNDRDESVISYADYALAMVDEAERTGTPDAHIREHLSVVRK
ncbi:NAD(P)-dependent oxidoreductase [Bifidobacterium cuniculi]|uniref:NADH-flavin reductase n=1 Tax=Bifidobacterium cuniculi TaxID=1688 RepID=A0A087ATD5_9BIFI|nr:NAD(P)H-binding protein [Bifidobacterium cuniculi]KFI62035.1 NADH-flavin reductase [Bifidobacterium cuniculi]